MKKNGRIILITMIFLVGFGFFVYPFIASWMYQRSALKVQVIYQEAISEIDQDELDRIFAATQEYNEALVDEGVILTEPFDPERYNVDAMYMRLPTESAEIGYVSIPKLKVTLPIYHTTANEVLELGAGHMPHTSLPVGGPGTHAAISAHCGMPNAELFTNLDRLQVGNLFQIDILGKTLMYKVYEKETVSPDQIESLTIQPGKDLVTLITCTPIGINTHRLLVHGERVADELTEELTEPEIPHKLMYTDYVKLVAIALSLVFLVLLLLLVLKGR